MPGSRRERTMELPNLGHDFIAEPRPVEHAVVTNFALLVVRFSRRGNAATKFDCGGRLAKPGYVVVFAFHGKQARTVDGVKINLLAAVFHLTLGQGVPDKYSIDGL